MEMNNNKNYAVLMKKQKLENDFFLFLPTSLIDGVVSKEEESTFINEMDDKYIDIESCFDPVFEPPAELLEEWSKQYEGPEPTLENTSFYVVGPDGTKYFYCGNLCIKISEHFADGGKQMDELVEDAVRHHAGRDSSAPTFLNAV